jgi:nicotinate-nucleotide--dimethylbenzimidazole phosphoribosyltransferase
MDREQPNQPPEPGPQPGADTEAEIEAEIAALAAGIEPASEPHDAALRARAAEGAPGGPGARDARGAGLADIAALAGRLAGAQHTLLPQVTRRCVVVCAADHGVSAGRDVHLDDALGLRPDHEAPTRSVLRHLAAGQSAMSAAAHAAGASLLVVDCGMRGDPSDDGVLDLRLGAGTADIRQGPAMSRLEAALSVRTGVALLLSLAENGLDVVGLGQVAVGARAVSSAVVAALAGVDPDLLGQADHGVVTAALAANRVDAGDPLAVLAALGGYEMGVLAGVVLAASSLRIPVMLDDHGTSAAALLAARWQPAVRGYLFAAHPGTTPTHRQALRALGLTPILGQALSYGEGTGAAMALPFLDTAANWARTGVDALFVYGSLRSVHPAHARVSPYVADIAPATAAGRLALLGGGYPGLVDDISARVTGELLTLRDLDAALAALDDYEGDEYRRVLRAVTLADGNPRLAWCYVATAAALADGSEPIPGDDWLAWLRATGRAFARVGGPQQSLPLRRGLARGQRRDTARLATGIPSHARHCAQQARRHRRPPRVVQFSRDAPHASNIVSRPAALCE